MRWLVNGICFSFSLFLQQQLREKNKKNPSKTCCMNSVFHLSAGGLKPEHGEKHAEDKMPRRAVSFSPLAFCVHWFTFSSESVFPHFSSWWREQLLFVCDALGMDGGAHLGKSLMKRPCIHPVWTVPFTARLWENVKNSNSLDSYCCNLWRADEETIILSPFKYQVPAR